MGEFHRLIMLYHASDVMRLTLLNMDFVALPSGYAVACGSGRSYADSFFLGFRSCTPSINDQTLVFIWVSKRCLHKWQRVTIRRIM
jgi:hypothetical protein